MNDRPSTEIKAVILAAGIASRLRPLTDHTPKCLLDVAGQSILERTIENLLLNQIRDIIIVTGYREEQIRSFMRERFPNVPVQYVYNPVFDSTNNIYSLWLARNAVGGHAMLLLDSDIVFDPDILGLLLNAGHDACVALQRHPLGDEEIKVLADAAGRIVQIGKDVDPVLAQGESVGIELFGADAAHDLFQEVDRMVRVEQRVNIFYEAAFQEWIATRGQVFAVDIGNRFCMEIDTASDLDVAGQLAPQPRL